MTSQPDIILASMTDGVITLDQEGHITAFNPAAESILGLDRGEAAGRLYAEVFFSEAENDGFNQVLLDLVTSQEGRPYTEVPFRRQDKELRHLALTTSLLTDPLNRTRLGAVMVFKDITTVHRLRQQRDRLAQELAVKHEELKGAYAELQVFNQAKAKMIDHLSHELKTPLAVVSASLKLLRKAALRQDEARLEALLERVGRNVQRLLELEDETRDIAERGQFQERRLLEGLVRQSRDLLATWLEEGNLPPGLVADLERRIEEFYRPGDQEPREIQLQRWIPEVLDAQRELQRHRQVRLELALEPSPPVLIPEPPLFKAFRGLYRNAVENTPDGGAVRIELQPRDGRLRLSVRDFGVGLEAGSQAELFHGFIHQGDTQDYATRRPYDFGAGGKGGDLLRTKLFSERLGFALLFQSRRCPHISPERPCPGRIEFCPACPDEEACHRSGGSVFTLDFPASMLGPAPEETRIGREA